MQVEIEGVNLEKLLRDAQEAGIRIARARRTDVRTMRLDVPPHQRAALAALCERRGWLVREGRADWVTRLLRLICRRPFLPAGLLLGAAMVWLSSQMILCVRVENAQQSEAEVRRFLEEAGVRPGRFKAAFSVDDLRARMAYSLPGLSFAGMRYEGSTLIIDGRTAREGEQLLVRGSAMDIVAAQPGIVTRIWASSGTPLVEPGQAVRRGQVLIRGEEKREKGQAHPVQAQGQVLARVFVRGQACASLTQKHVRETGRTRRRVTLRSPWHVRVVREAQPFDSQLVTRQTQRIAGLYLPLRREIETFEETEVSLVPRSQADAASIAEHAAHEIAKKQCPPGASILDKTVDYSMIDNEFVYAMVVLEYEAPIAGRIKE